jgi:hypothetical protein
VWQGQWEAEQFHSGYLFHRPDAGEAALENQEPEVPFFRSWPESIVHRTASVGAVFFVLFELDRLRRPWKGRFCILPARNSPKVPHSRVFLTSSPVRAAVFPCATTSVKLRDTHFATSLCRRIALNYGLPTEPRPPAKTCRAATTTQEIVTFGPVWGRFHLGHAGSGLRPRCPGTLPAGTTAWLGITTKGKRHTIPRDSFCCRPVWSWATPKTPHLHVKLEYLIQDVSRRDWVIRERPLGTWHHFEQAPD